MEAEWQRSETECKTVMISRLKSDVYFLDHQYKHFWQLVLVEVYTPSVLRYMTYFHELIYIINTCIL